MKKIRISMLLMATLLMSGCNDADVKITVTICVFALSIVFVLAIFTTFFENISKRGK
jgi:hypothetical protein